MIRAAKLVALLSAFLLAHCATQALTNDNPYNTIIDRNPFGLNPPPPPPTNAPPEPPKNVKFNGITNVGGKKRAFFTIQPKDGKEQPQYVSLAENESANNLEVTQINEADAEVEVVNSGIKMVLNFKNNGNKPATLAQPPGAPHMGGMAPPQPMPIPGGGSPVAGTVYTPGAYNPVVAQPVAGNATTGAYPTPQPGTVPGNPNPNPQEIRQIPTIPTIPTRSLRINPPTP
jgi:hypothetical protein